MVKKKYIIIEGALLLFSLIIFFFLHSCKEEPSPESKKITVESCFAGSIQLLYSAEANNVPLNADLTVKFSTAIDTVNIESSVLLLNESGNIVSGLKYSFSEGYKVVKISHSQYFTKAHHYTLKITGSLKGLQGQPFGGIEYKFYTLSGEFNLASITIDNKDFNTGKPVNNVSLSGSVIDIKFGNSLDTTAIKSKFNLSGGTTFDVDVSSDNKTVQLKINSQLTGYKKYYFSISSTLRTPEGMNFKGFSNSFFAELDSTPKFPIISDDELLTLIQQRTFKYFYNYAHPVSGLTRERYNSGDIVTSGGSGFGIMALIVGIERSFITRDEGVTRLEKIVSFLENADRFHGAWSHWLNGSTGVVIPFGTKDNGGDLVETSFMAQGLITIRQYLDENNATEAALIDRINQLLDSIEWDWYTRGGQNVLYWHWSPNYNWDMNFQLRGYMECMITYVMAASSSTHTIPKAAYTMGWARNGAMVNGKSFYGYNLPLGYDYGGPLFFAHYSFLGLDPRNLNDEYANYWTQNVNHSLINWAYCVDNPKNFPNYNSYCWGLTASDIPSGYSASSPTNDLGVITPTAAISSLPYTPEQSMNAIRYFYFIIGDKLWGDYGFYDAFDVQEDWWASSYLAIDQGPEICMIENYRTGLLWNLFMSAPEVQQGLTKLGFTYSKKHAVQRR